MLDKQNFEDLVLWFDDFAVTISLAFARTPSIQGDFKSHYVEIAPDEKDLLPSSLGLRLGHCELPQAHYDFHFATTKFE